MAKSIIFDMDGVVVNSIECDFSSWKKVLQRFGKDLSFDEYKRFSGMKAKQIFRQYGEDVTDDSAILLENEKDDYFAECLKKGSVTIPRGLISLLDLLLDNMIDVSLATAASRKKVDSVLEYFGIASYFRVIITGDDVSAGKPDPQIFLKASTMLGLRPEECVVIEDAPNGIRAAKKGNMKCIAITATHKAEELTEADMIINAFTELTFPTLQRL